MLGAARKSKGDSEISSEQNSDDNLLFLISKINRSGKEFSNSTIDETIIHLEKNYRNPEKFLVFLSKVMKEYPYEKTKGKENIIHVIMRDFFRNCIEDENHTFPRNYGFPVVFYDEEDSEITLSIIFSSFGI